SFDSLRNILFEVLSISFNISENLLCCNSISKIRLTFSIYRPLSSFNFTLYSIIYSTSNQPLSALELFHILNSILLCFLKSAKKLSLFQTTYILPLAVIPYRPIFPRAHLLPTLLTVRLALSLKCVVLWRLAGQNERYGCRLHL